MTTAKKATAPKRPQDRKPRATTKAAPAVDVALDLDELEREGEIPEPFPITFGGKTFILADPAEFDYQQYALASTSPSGERKLLKLIFGDQYAEFLATLKENPLPQWKLWKMIGDWQAHYGMPELGKSDD